MSARRTFLVLLFFISMAVTIFGSNFTVTEEVWFDIEVQDMDGPGEHYKGRFTVGLFGEAAPMTVLNFVAIAKGYQTRDAFLSYKGTYIHRIVPDFVIQMGDITIGDGTGGKSIFGNRFNDEPFILSHRSPGWIAMANHGPDTNGSQFYIMLTKARWLDGKHVVFAKVIKGFEVIQTLGELKTNPDNAIPKNRVKIVDCGVVGLKEKYVLKPSQLDRTDDF